MLEVADSARITTVVDNNTKLAGLLSCWGLSFHIELINNGQRFCLLIDTSGSHEALFTNASKVGINFQEISATFISHWHRDHCGALTNLLPLLRHPIPVYLPSRNPSVELRIKELGGTPIVATKPQRIAHACMSTGRIEGRISEHSVIINIKDKGLIVLTGCAHPGLIKIIETSRQVSGVSMVHGVMGGFHVSREKEAKRISEYLQGLKVKLVSPCHCTGAAAKEVFKTAMGDKYVENGSGTMILA